MLLAASCMPAQGDPGERVLEMLHKIESENTWGEVVLKSGAVRPIRVLEIDGEQVFVREVVGALHERPATYLVDDFKSIRELGIHRIAMRHSSYQPPRSSFTTLALEAAIPGAGYFYIGESRQGVSLLLFSTAAIATGFMTGKDGAAGWIPLAAWTKVASLLHLNDEVNAINSVSVDNRGSTALDHRNRRGRLRGVILWPVAQFVFGY